MHIGYHSSHEQFSPSELLTFVQLAEQAGFKSAMSSEHIAPWSERQGHSGFAWAWLGAAMQMTKMPFGSLAIPGGWRYHPVVTAHAFATLAQMFPGRLPWIAIGSGEAMNEIMVGMGWPDKAERNARLREAADIMRALWRGETVNRNQGYLHAHQAKLWTLPETPPKLYGAALSVETAGWMGEWADGLITVRLEVEKLKPILNAFKENGGQDKPIVLQLQMSWAETLEEARENAHHQWRHAAADAKKDELLTPQDFDQVSEDVTKNDMHDAMLITHDAQEIVDYIKEYAALGFDEIYVHNAGRNQREFIDFFGRSVLPFL